MNRTSFEPDFGVTVTSGEAAEAVIRVRGELDSGTCEEFLDTFRSLLGTGTARTVTLDLSEVSFIDSAGTRAVIMIEREARDGGASVVVTTPPDEVTVLLRTAGVIEHLQLRPDATGAVADSASPVERVELELPLDPRSPARARAEVRELMMGRDQTQIGDVVLMTSEIVTNAVVHPGAQPESRVGLRIFIHSEGIRVEVDDTGNGFDPTLPTTPGPERGRGLFLVDRFASRWGTERLEGERGRRFMVWFELDWRQERNLEPATE